MKIYCTLIRLFAIKVLTVARFYDVELCGGAFNLTNDKLQTQRFADKNSDENQTLKPYVRLWKESSP